MTAVQLNMMGRFGNQLFQYAYGKWFCEHEGFTLQTHPWIGQKIFQNVNDPPPNRPTITLPEGYYQDQDSVRYTKADLRRWFEFKPAIMDMLKPVPAGGVVAHLRRGDYVDLGWPLVSKRCIEKKAESLGIATDSIQWLTEESPTTVPGCPKELSFLPDFYRMMIADVLFRSNSTFSWWPGTLGTAKVYAPIVQGLHGGENDCEFADGNWPMTVDLPFITDLHINDQ